MRGRTINTRIVLALIATLCALALLPGTPASAHKVSDFDRWDYYSKPQLLSTQWHWKVTIKSEMDKTGGKYFSKGTACLADAASVLGLCPAVDLNMNMKQEHYRRDSRGRWNLCTSTGWKPQNGRHDLVLRATVRPVCGKGDYRVKTTLFWDHPNLRGGRLSTTVTSPHHWVN